MMRAHDETSAALLAAAHRLLAEHGAEALTVRRIAAEAGMSTMNVYSRFGGKDGVIDELFCDGFQRLGRVLDSVPKTSSAIDDIRTMANAYREFARSNPTYYRIMFRSSIPGFNPSAESDEIALSSLVSLVARVQDAQHAGLIAVDSPPADLAAWLWATCHGMITLELDEIATEMVSWPAIWERGLRVTLTALHPSTDTSLA